MAHRRHHLFAAVAAIALGSWWGPTQAQTNITLTNPGFEDDFAPAGGFPVLLPNGWTLYDPAGIVGSTGQGTNAVGVLNPTGSTFFVDPVPEGNNAALVYLEQRAGSTDAGDPVGLFNTFDGMLQAGMRYTLSVGVGNIASGTGLGDPYAGYGPYDLSGFPGYRVELLAGDQVLAFDDSSLSIGEGRFMTSTVEYMTGGAHALAGSVLGVRLINLNASGNLDERAREVDFDNVQLMAVAVPEPHEYAMWLAGLGLLLGARARRRHLR